MGNHFLIETNETYETSETVEMRSIHEHPKKIEMIVSKQSTNAVVSFLTIFTTLTTILTHTSVNS